MYRASSPSFDPALAEVAVVSREGREWFLRVHRFTGERLLVVPLHVDGDFDSVHRLVDHVLASRSLAAAPLVDWIQAGNHWSSVIRSDSLANGSHGVLI